MGFRANRKTMLRVRPTFVLACVGVLTALILPGVIAGRPVLQRAMLVLATITVGLGWVSLLSDPKPNLRWRSWISLVTAAYLTASVPAFFFELSPLRWFLRHPGWAVYVGPWVHYGYALMCLGILGSFCAQSRARVALLVGSIALVSLRASMGTWIL